MRKQFTQEELRAILDYNPDTGVFTAKVKRCQSGSAGEVAGHVSKKGYRVIKVKGSAYKAHRLALFYVKGVWPSDQVDHINGVKDDNRLANLREADSFINSQNKKTAVRGSASGLVGAHRGAWKGRRWVSEICHNGVRTFLGVFQTAEEAHFAYVDAKRKLHQGCTI